MNLNPGGRALRLGVGFVLLFVQPGCRSAGEARAGRADSDIVAAAPVGASEVALVDPAPVPPPEPVAVAVLPEPEPPWHLPVAEREPANRVASAIMETLDGIAENLAETTYRHRTSVNHNRGVYHWDCSGMAAWLLEREAPRARAAMEDDRPVARDFYDMIEDSSTGEARRGWRRVERPELIAPGDIFAWRKPEAWRDRPNTGHVGFIVETPQPHPEFANVWLIRIADATRYPHEDDTRVAGGEGGFGTGTMAFLFDPEGQPMAYGWYGSAQHPDTFVRTRIGFGRVSR